MDFTCTYCPTRRDLEERGWFLTSRLAAQTTNLMKLLGRDHQAFLNLRAGCRSTTLEIQESHRNLHDHRREHGC